MKYIYFGFSLVLIFLAQSCNKSGSELEPKFYSADNPGKWKEQQATHTAQITEDGGDNERQIHVSIPMAPNPGHYIEVILLTDDKHKELAKKVLARSEQPVADFTLPKGNNSRFYVVIKCNLHDMWEVEVKSR